MATYNGSRFLSQQLASIAAQSRLPDELVVSDDCSTDDTLAIVRQFAANTDFPVRVYVNDQNSGVSLNFQHAIQEATGDILLLCDQDDVWNSEKIQRVEDYFVGSPETALVFHDVNVVDENLVPLGYTSWDRLGFGTRDQQRVVDGFGFDVLLQHCFVAGATLAFRSCFKSFVLPIPALCFYDTWITMVIAAIANVSIIPEQLAAYRQHRQQVMGGERKGLLRMWREARRDVSADYFYGLTNQYDVLRQRVIESCCALESWVLPMIDAKRRLCLVRAKMRLRPSLRYFLILRELCTGRYHRYAHGWKTVALDMVV
ncbi:MAG: hypothetical protein BWK76_10360 [Desulfobulbaceae bacterium A2]|nr:MAG: hypothetical protein BWK76_10360 [Desulfobulbaceae bacterium A2]